MDSSFSYCLVMAFLGSLSMRTIMSSVRPWRVTVTGSLPRNSGIMPNALRSSLITCFRISGSLSYVSFRTEPKPMEDFFLRRSFMISSRSGNAPPHINSILSVFTVAMGVMAFFWLEPTGTSTVLPSKSLRSSCCTDSPLTSLVLVCFFLAILSISSIKIMPRCARSTSLSAAARSLDTTLSISSPIYPASVSEVASAMARGTSRRRARVLTR